VFIKRATIDVPMENPETNEAVEKVVFMIFFQGEQLKNR
jgi:hypothetical protein